MFLADHSLDGFSRHIAHFLLASPTFELAGWETGGRFKADEGDLAHLVVFVA